jgi:hypothetical protein
MRREQFIFRGCLLLLPLVFCIAVAFISVISGGPANVLNRLGIIFQMIGILAVMPDLIGEQRLERTISNVQGYEKTQRYMKDYLYGSEETPTEELPPFLVILDLVGNFIMSALLVFLAVALVFAHMQISWIAISLYIAFGILGIEALTWIILFPLFLAFRPLVHKRPNLFSYFLTTNSMISTLGVLISSALAYLISAVIPLLIYISKIPLRKLIAGVTLPFLLIGGALQLIATYF